MRLTRRRFLQLPLIAGITLAANKALAFATRPIVTRKPTVDRFYRKINGTNDKGNKILEMFFSRTPDFSDNPEPIIINVNSFENKQEMADAIDILQRFAIEDMIQSRRKGKDYSQPYEIVYMNGEMLEKSEYYETLDVEVGNMVDKMELDTRTLVKKEGDNYPSFDMDGLDYSDISEDAAHEKKVQKIMERQRERSFKTTNRKV